MHALDAKTFQRTEVIDVSQFVSQCFEDFPMPVAGCDPIALLQVRFKVSLYTIVVDEHVVDVEQEDNSGRFDHRALVLFFERSVSVCALLGRRFSSCWSYQAVLSRFPLYAPVRSRIFVAVP